jgi:hypothetical protein
VHAQGAIDAATPVRTNLQQAQQMGNRPAVPAGQAPNLYCVSYGGLTPHWGFVHKIDPLGKAGMLIHINATLAADANPAQSAAPNLPTNFLTKPLTDVSKTTIDKIYPIRGAFLSRDDAVNFLATAYRRATHNKYNLFQNNCQHFCIAGIEAVSGGPCPGITQPFKDEIYEKMSLITQLTHAITAIKGAIKQ